MVSIVYLSSTFGGFQHRLAWVSSSSSIFCHSRCVISAHIHPHMLNLSFFFKKFLQGAEETVSFDLKPSTRSILRRPTFSVPSSASHPVSVSVPLEVAIQIIEAAYYDDDEHSPDNTVLTACSLVCRDWTIPAQKLLFSRVSIRSRTALASFLRAIDSSTEHGRMLAQSVLCMRFVLDHCQPNGLNALSFARAVASCPKLYELELSLYGNSTSSSQETDSLRSSPPAQYFDDDVLTLLQSGPPVKALSISNWSANTNSALFELLAIWPSVRSLSVTGATPQLPSLSIPPFASALEELRFNLKSSPSTTFLGWLLQNSVDSLKVLEFAREPLPNVLEYLIGTHGLTLESVILPAWAGTNAALLWKCPALKEMVVENPTSSVAAYKNLPETIEHVGFGLDSDTVLMPVLELIKSKNSLKAMSVHIWNGETPHPHLSALQMSCAYHGIDLRITHSMPHFRRMIVSSSVPFAAVSFN
jgi:hypothetical protein